MGLISVFRVWYCLCGLWAKKKKKKAKGGNQEVTWCPWRLSFVLHQKKAPPPTLPGSLTSTHIAMMPTATAATLIGPFVCHVFPDTQFQLTSCYITLTNRLKKKLIWRECWITGINMPHLWGGGLRWPTFLNKPTNIKTSHNAIWLTQQLKTTNHTVIMISLYGGMNGLIGFARLIVKNKVLFSWLFHLLIP